MVGRQRIGITCTAATAVCVHAWARVRACVRACVRTRVHAYACVCACVRACVRACLPAPVCACVMCLQYTLIIFDPG